jgi:hypothetical protein
MLTALTPRLPATLRRDGASVMPFFPIVRVKQTHRFSINFLRFSGFFEKERTRQKNHHFLLRVFAASREPLAPSRHTARPYDFTRSREEKKIYAFSNRIVSQA